MAYGAAIAAKEYVTEKMFSIALPFSRIYGGGSMDDAVEGVIRKAVDKLASTQEGQKVLGGLLTMAASGVTEGLEEFIGDWMEWQMPRIYGGDVASAQETLESSLYDFTVGNMAGLVGGVTSVGQYDTVEQTQEQKGAAEKTALENAVQGQKNASGKEAKYTIQRDAAGDVYVQIDVDILKGKPKEQWGQTIRKEIQRIFGKGIKLGRGMVFTNRRGRGEYTNGSYTKMLERTDPQMHQDKMRMAVGSDGIVENAANVTYEGAEHERKDDIVGFNRGKIIVSVKGSGYTGDVLTAIYSDGRETFFDINNLERKNIEAAPPERYTVQDGFTQTGDTASDFMIEQTDPSVKNQFMSVPGESPGTMGLSAPQGAGFETELLKSQMCDKLATAHPEADPGAIENLVDAAWDMATGKTGVPEWMDQAIERLVSQDKPAPSRLESLDIPDVLRDLAREMAEESELRDVFRRTVKGFAEGGKVVSFKNLPQKFQGEFLAGLDLAKPQVRDILIKACDKVDYVLGREDRSYYRGSTGRGKGTVYLGRNATASTMVHELFHQIDEYHQISTTLSAGLTQDYVALNVASGGDIKEYLMERYPEAFKLSRRGIPVMHSQYRGIADILNGLSDGQVSYGYRHKREYWQKQGALEAEAWAQLGRILFENDPQALKMFSDIFPNLLKNGIMALEGSN